MSICSNDDEMEISRDGYYIDEEGFAISPPLFVYEDVDYSVGMKTQEVYDNLLLIEDRYKIYNPKARFLKWR